MHEWIEPMGQAQGVMFDVDGTLILSDRQLGSYQRLPGAAEALAALRERHMPFVLLTNGSAYPGPEQAEKLRQIGLPIEDAQMLTPNSVAAGIMRQRGVGSVMVLGTDGVSRAFGAEGIATVPPATGEGADAVYVGWHPDCTMDHIHAAAEAVLEGAALYSASDAPFFATRSGRAFGYSCAINGAIARITGIEPEVTGKPSLHALDFVAAKLGIKRHALAVVGDDPRVETEMARRGGAIGIGVTTGATSRAEWAEQDQSRRPHRIVDSLEQLLELGLFV